MISRIPYYLFVAIFLSKQATAFQVVNTNGGVSSPTSSGASTPTTRTSTSQLNYANAQTVDNTVTGSDSFTNSILDAFQREESQVSISQLLTEQVAREFTAGRRYLLAASAVKDLSEDFYDVEEQQRVRAMELMEYARTNDIELLDYASQVDKTPIDKSLKKQELLQELLIQEQKDVKLLEQVMAQVSSKNAKLFAFLEVIRADQMERKDQIMQTLADAFPTIQQSAADTASVTTTAQASTGDFGQDLLNKLDNADQIPSSVSRWSDNQLQGMGQHIHDLISKSSGHFTFTGATAATVAAVDVVDPESLPNPENFLQAMDTEALSQLVDIVSGVY
ncbi:unnamed protein product [Cylindrotheca closterium]|uniref:Uncharacterized protein n=1 Tax=Cylindrotheca closterium TaxID=2856 RepID=A0AAD2PW50_9STRA|nr:unnamed protein product [Cylindrotheca closterium]